MFQKAYNCIYLLDYNLTFKIRKHEDEMQIFLYRMPNQTLKYVWFAPVDTGVTLSFFFGGTEVSHLLGRSSTAWATLLALFALILEIGSHFLPRLAWTWSSYFTFPAVVGMTGTITPAFFPLGYDLINIFCPAGLDPWSSWSQPLMYLGWQVWATVPSYWWRWGLVNYLPRQTSNSNLPYLSLPSS
jgi:hypothetical protein